LYIKLVIASKLISWCTVQEILSYCPRSTTVNIIIIIIIITCTQTKGYVLNKVRGFLKNCTRMPTFWQHIHKERRIWSLLTNYRIPRPIRRTFFPEKCDLNSTCVFCAEGKYYFQTYKYPYIYYTTSLSWDSENNHEDDFSGSDDDFLGFYDK
jgi:hypothetical protein